MDIKVMGYLRCAREVAPHMQAQRWGRIINISGLAARQSGNAVGSMRNVSVAAMTKNLADELGPDGINVTVVHPGLTRTERTAALVAHAGPHAKSVGAATSRSEWRRATRSGTWSTQPRWRTSWPSWHRRSRSRSTATRSPPGGGALRSIHY
jgi:NAD(P)-dependent dehydrogenase (short-subunit alcohol dehydrogenase family)